PVSVSRERRPEGQPVKHDGVPAPAVRSYRLQCPTIPEGVARRRISAGEGAAASAPCRRGRGRHDAAELGPRRERGWRERRHHRRARQPRLRCEGRGGGGQVICIVSELSCTGVQRGTTRLLSA
ncbi:unnamed protein product, partial [Urochloa humidicola]